MCLYMGWKLQHQPGENPHTKEKGSKMSGRPPMPKRATEKPIKTIKFS